MEGAKRLRHHVPFVIRTFVPNRLAEELETRAYERLLAIGCRGGVASSDIGETTNDGVPEFEVEELIAIGGRS